MNNRRNYNNQGFRQQRNFSNGRSFGNNYNQFPNNFGNFGGGNRRMMTRRNNNNRRNNNKPMAICRVDGLCRKNTDM